MFKQATRFLSGSLSVALGLTVAGPAALAAEDVLKTFDCDTMDGVITTSGVGVDTHDAKDGKGCLRMWSGGAKPMDFRLFEVGGLDVDGARILYRAKVKTKDVKGKAYLEMWCRVADKGEFFSRGMDQVLTGTNGWSSQEIPFFLQAGQKCDRVKLNLVVEGGGTAWIDDVQLVKAPL